MKTYLEAAEIKPDTTWVKSARSGAAGHCVQTANVAGGVALGHSKDPERGAFLFTTEEMAAFVQGAKDGDFDHHLTHGLTNRAQLVPLMFVAAGSAEARTRFPDLDHDATLRDLTLIADSGLVYVGDAAWAACLWSLADYREMGERLTSPRLLPTARRFIAAASAVRDSTRRSSPPPSLVGAGTRHTAEWGHPDYGDKCDDSCR